MEIPAHLRLGWLHLAVRIPQFKLPLTLAVLDSLLLRVGEQTYVMPLVSIVESIRPRPEQVRDLAGRGEVGQA